MLTELQPELVPILDVLQITRDEVVQPPDEVPLPILMGRRARDCIRSPFSIGTCARSCRCLGLHAHAQRVLEEELRDDGLEAHIE